MKDLSFANEAQIQLLKAQTGIGPGLPGKGEGAITLPVKGDESKGGENIFIRNETPGPDACAPPPSSRKTASP